uniref:Uncharacterized protein LOC113798261 n=1 Tax=Dermatophagoides pteronyssinus TaxID=6956 RepID=A0A6P6YI86_DERPT|nr:uncharacterized protein LOC113798261 [Dermatophagoides pteronyssinus]
MKLSNNNQNNRRHRQNIDYYRFECCNYHSIAFYLALILLLLLLLSCISLIVLIFVVPCPEPYNQYSFDNDNDEIIIINNVTNEWNLQWIRQHHSKLFEWKCSVTVDDNHNYDDNNDNGTEPLMTLSSTNVTSPSTT